jgi:hypothetical protein
MPMSRRGQSPVVRGERVEEVFAFIYDGGSAGDGGYRYCGQHDLRGAFNTPHLEACRRVQTDQDLLVLAHRHRHCNSATLIATVPQTFTTVTNIATVLQTLKYCNRVATVPQIATVPQALQHGFTSIATVPQALQQCHKHCNTVSQALQHIAINIATLFHKYCNATLSLSFVSSPSRRRRMGPTFPAAYSFSPTAGGLPRAGS